MTLLIAESRTYSECCDLSVQKRYISKGSLLHVFFFNTISPLTLSRYIEVVMTQYFEIHFVGFYSVDPIVQCSAADHSTYVDP